MPRPIRLFSQLPRQLKAVDRLVRKHRIDSGLDIEAQKSLESVGRVSAH
jgi:hypothetical protein